MAVQGGPAEPGGPQAEPLLNPGADPGRAGDDADAQGFVVLQRELVHGVRVGLAEGAVGVEARVGEDGVGGGGC